MSKDIKLQKWKAEVRNYWNNQCAYCGKKDGFKNIKGRRISLQCHHLISKSLGSIFKYDVRNGILLCPGCHTFKITSFHKNPVMSIHWFENRNPEIFAYLMELTINKIKGDK